MQLNSCAWFWPAADLRTLEALRTPLCREQRRHVGKLLGNCNASN